MTPIIQAPITARYPYIPPTFDPAIDWTDLYETTHFRAHMDTANPLVVCRWRGAPFFSLLSLDHETTYTAMAAGALELIPSAQTDWLEVPHGPESR
jgi:hypothetical protein